MLLKLSLTYPNCRTILERTADFEAFKSRYQDLEFGNLEPDVAG